MNQIEFLRTAKIEDLGLPDQVLQNLFDQNLSEIKEIYLPLQSYQAFCKFCAAGVKV